MNNEKHVLYIQDCSVFLVTFKKKTPEQENEIIPVTLPMFQEHILVSNHTFLKSLEPV